MSRTLRRFEVLPPLRFNDGSQVPDEFVADTLLELEERFGAVSCETATIRGQWRHEGQSYRDDLIRVFVDIADDPAHRAFFTEFQDRLKGRFGRLDHGWDGFSGGIHLNSSRLLQSSGSPGSGLLPLAVASGPRGVSEA